MRKNKSARCRELPQEPRELQASCCFVPTNCIQSFIDTVGENNYVLYPINYQEIIQYRGGPMADSHRTIMIRGCFDWLTSQEHSLLVGRQTQPKHHEIANGQLTTMLTITFQHGKWINNPRHSVSDDTYVLFYKVSKQTLQFKARLHKGQRLGNK